MGGFGEVFTERQNAPTLEGDVRLRMRLDALIMRKLGYGPLGPCHVAVFGTLLASFTGFLCRRKTCACRHCATRGWLPTVPPSTYIHDIGDGCVSGMLAAVADELMRCTWQYQCYRRNKEGGWTSAKCQ